MPYTPKQNSGMLGDVFADMNQLDGTGLGAVDPLAYINAFGQVVAPDTTADIAAWAEDAKVTVAPLANVLPAVNQQTVNNYLNPPKTVAPTTPGAAPTVVETTVDTVSRTITENQPLLLGGLALLAGALLFMRKR